MSLSQLGERRCCCHLAKYQPRIPLCPNNIQDKSHHDNYLAQNTHRAEGEKCCVSDSSTLHRERLKLGGWSFTPQFRAQAEPIHAALSTHRRLGGLQTGGSHSAEFQRPGKSKVKLPGERCARSVPGKAPPGSAGLSSHGVLAGRTGQGSLLPLMRALSP